MKRPSLEKLIALLLILVLGAAVLYLYYYNESAPQTHTKEINLSEDLIYSTFPKDNQTIIKIKESHILNMTSDHGILTIVVKYN
jgi:hypothetical protein